MSHTIRNRFYLNGSSSTPIWSDLKLEKAKQSSEEYFRYSLTGTISYLNADYDRIMAEDEDYKWTVLIQHNDSGSWDNWYQGYFYLSDCKINLDDENIEVNLKTDDDYETILNGMDKEYDLLKLSPQVESIGASRRAIMQVYRQYDNQISNFINNNYWQEEVLDSLADETLLTDSAASPTFGYNFSKSQEYYIIEPSDDMTVDVSGVYSISGTQSDGFGNPATNIYRRLDGGYEIKVYNPLNSYYHWMIYDVATSSPVYREADANIPPSPQEIPDGTEFHDYSSSTLGYPVIGTVRAVIDYYTFYSRFIHDDSSASSPVERAENDITEHNENYSYVSGILMPDNIVITENTSASNQGYGAVNDEDKYNGLYYDRPTDIPPLGGAWIPLNKSSWTWYSMWYSVSPFTLLIEDSYRNVSFDIKHSYPLWSVTDVVLNELGFANTIIKLIDFSTFLYDTNPISGIEVEYFLTPKSNIVKGDYDQPAQKAPIKLRELLEVLKAQFNLYWFIDDGKFRLEHKSYFDNGGSYTSSLVTQVDLTTTREMRNMKFLDYETNTYTYDKAETFSRIQFDFMDDQSFIFEGFPIEILSKNVEEDQIKELSASIVSTDLDMIMATPSIMMLDGFVMFTATDKVVDFVDLVHDGVTYKTQNGYLSWFYLAQYHKYGLPVSGSYPLPPTARNNIIVNEVSTTAESKERLKTNEVGFHVQGLLDENGLIKTSIGEGKIEKIVVNLEDNWNNITLKYD